MRSTRAAPSSATHAIGRQLIEPTSATSLPRLASLTSLAPRAWRSPIAVSDRERPIRYPSINHQGFAMTRLVACGSLALVLVGCGASSCPCPASPASSAATPAQATARPLLLEAYPSAQEVGEPGWILSGGAHEEYAVRRDASADRPSWLLEPVSDTFGRYGTWMRHIEAADYRGKRVRITATVKTRGATNRVDFWARAQAKDSPGDGAGLGGDWEKLPADTDWSQNTIVFDVPDQTEWLEYGVGVAGPGVLWLDGAKIEVVGSDVPVSRGFVGGNRSPSAHANATAVQGWSLTGDDTPEYAVALDTAIKHAGRASGSLKSTAAQPKGFGTLDQWLGVEPYLGKRLRLRAYVKAENVTGWAGLWMRVDDSSGRHASTAFDNMEHRPIKGTVDWTRYDIVLDVAPNAGSIAFGVLLHGAGQVWIDDVSFDLVDAKVPTTGQAKSAGKPAENLDFEN